MCKSSISQSTTQIHKISVFRLVGTCNVTKFVLETAAVHTIANEIVIWSHATHNHLYTKAHKVRRSASNRNCF